MRLPGCGYEYTTTQITMRYLGQQSCLVVCESMHFVWWFDLMRSLLYEAASALEWNLRRVTMFREPADLVSIVWCSCYLRSIWSDAHFSCRYMRNRFQHSELRECEERVPCGSRFSQRGMLHCLHRHSVSVLSRGERLQQHLPHNVHQLPECSRSLSRRLLCGKLRLRH